MDKVKKLIEAGSSITGAIKESLGMTVTAFADSNGLAMGAVSDALSGARRPSAAIIAALVNHLGGTPDEWRMLLWEAARPDVASAADETAEAEVL